MAGLRGVARFRLRGIHYCLNRRRELGPISLRTFYRFLKALEDKGIKGLNPLYGRNGRNRFANVTPAERDFLANFLLDQNKPKISNAILECKRNFGEYSVSSPATLRRYISILPKRRNDIWTNDREGQKAWNDKVAPYQDRDAMMLKVGEVLVADGHRLNARILDPVTGKSKRPTIVLFWDWKSTFPLGLGVSFSENVQCIWEALRNAILTLGKAPDQIYVDNGRAFLAKVFTKKVVIEETKVQIPSMLERLKIKRRTALRYHAESKPIERFFRILNDSLERRLPSYMGSSTDDKPAYLLPNEPRARALHDDRIPTISELFQIFYQWREEYIDEPRPMRDNLTAKQIFEEGKGPGYDARELCLLMMVTEIKTVRRCRFTFAGVDWVGDCLYGYNDKVIIRYSLSDLSQIYVFDTHDRPIGVVNQAWSAHPVNDWQAAKRITNKRRILKRVTIQDSNSIRMGSLLMDGHYPPEMLEYIEAEEAKEPQNKIMRPWPDEPDSFDHISEEGDPDKIDMMADHDSPLSGPFYPTLEDWYYGWAIRQDPKIFNDADRKAIKEIENSPHYEKNLEDESFQRYLDRIKFKSI
jgi:hypothetical protein